MTNNAQQNKAKADAVLISQQWSGPLPPPAALAQFEQLIPHGAERILAMVEREQERRIDADKEELTASIKDTRRGHYVGLAIALFAILASTFTAYIGAHWSVSVALVSLPIAAIINSVLKRNN